MTYIAALGFQVDRYNVQHVGTAALRSAAIVQAAEFIHHVHKCFLPLHAVLISKVRKVET
jgi:hypothetical protein